MHASSLNLLRSHHHDRSLDCQDEGSSRTVEVVGQEATNGPIHLVRVRIGWKGHRGLTCCPRPLYLTLPVDHQPFCNFNMSSSIGYKYLGACLFRGRLFWQFIVQLIRIYFSPSLGRLRFARLCSLHSCVKPLPPHILPSIIEHAARGPNAWHRAQFFWAQPKHSSTRAPPSLCQAQHDP